MTPSTEPLAGRRTGEARQTEMQLQASTPIAPTPVLYVTAFQFSGSTLLAFLLNDHVDLATVGHMMGWPFDPAEDFRCSCGNPLAKCPFYAAIRDVFRAEGLAFEFDDFGTAYSLTKNERLNRALTAALPFASGSRFERARDRLIRTFPPTGVKLRRIDDANRLFIKTALQLNCATVFLDNSHSPYRLRQLGYVTGLDVRNIHLIRDPRGTVLSCMTNLGWSVELATRLWLRQQARILRIAGECQHSIRVFYEDLCRDTDTTLSRIHRFADLAPQAFCGDFKRKPHHILGNQMRLGGSTVRLDERWKRDLPLEQQRYVEHEAARAADRDPALKVLCERYFGGH